MQKRKTAREPSAQLSEGAQRPAQAAPPPAPPTICPHPHPIKGTEHQLQSGSCVVLSLHHTTSKALPQTLLWPFVNFY